METDPRTFRHWKSRTFSEAVVTNRSEYFSVKRIRKKLICCLSWSSREDCTDQLTYARSSQAARSNEYDRTGGHSSAVIIWGNSKYRAEFCVLRNLEDRDFNRAIYSGTILIFFLSHGGEECVRKQPPYMSSPSYFAAFLQTPYFYYSKVHVVGFLLSPTFCTREAIKLQN